MRMILSIMVAGFAIASAADACGPFGRRAARAGGYAAGYSGGSAGSYSGGCAGRSGGSYSGGAYLVEAPAAIVQAPAVVGPAAVAPVQTAPALPGKIVTTVTTTKTETIPPTPASFAMPTTAAAPATILVPATFFAQGTYLTGGITPPVGRTRGRIIQRFRTPTTQYGADPYGLCPYGICP